MMSFIGFVSLATVASADVTPPWWCFDTPDRGQFCGYYKAPTAELASIRATDEAEAKMCTALNCVQSANNGIGSTYHGTWASKSSNQKRLLLMGPCITLRWSKLSRHDFQHGSTGREARATAHNSRAYGRGILSVNLSFNTFLAISR